MPAISIQVNIINPSIFFESHRAAFVEPTASQSYAYWILDSASNVAPVNLASPLEIVITELKSGYTALQPIPVRVQRSGDAYTASFEEANIHASGDTWADAARALKSLILEIYDSLIGETLGPGPKRQLETLSRYVKPD